MLMFPFRDQNSSRRLGQRQTSNTPTAKRVSDLREAYQQSIWRKLSYRERRSSSARQNSNKNSLHNRPCLKLSQPSRSHDTRWHGRCQDQLLTRKLRRTPEEHQIHSESQPQPPPPHSYSPGPAWSEAQSRKTRCRTHASTKTRKRNADNETIKGQGQDPSRISRPTEDGQDGRYDLS